ncbi:MAG: hypothetical protein EAX81_05035 [Candidatus Thorarchaeota archaeon]|nr:hypothetical protein [Candidatus Thorarchaeota archaeon]
MNRKKVIYLAAVVSIVLCFMPVVMTPSAAMEERVTYMESDFVSKSILFDESHTDNGSSLWTPGNASLFSWILEEHGYNSTTNFNQPLDSGILTAHDIVVIFFPILALTPGEISAVQTFVESGGSLLAVGVSAANTWEFTVENLNPIVEPWGVEFNYDSITEVTSDFVTHNITEDVDSIWTYGDELSACTLNVSAPASSIIQISGKPLLAVAQPGLGRLVAAGSPGSFYMYRFGASIYGDSHFQLSVNIIDWLARNPQREISIPEIATVKLGNSPDLTDNEIDEYSIFTGLCHDHTTHSDGLNTPEEMVTAGVEIGLDFMVLTDHSHSIVLPIEGITGAQAAKEISDRYGLDIEQFIAAELSSVYHTVGFPLTENIWTSDQQESVNEIHAQGGIAILCHPTLSSGYGLVYEKMEEYGYDAVEINNHGYFFGGGEDGYLWPFWGASDGHSASYVGYVMNAAFVKDPSGPNGQITDEDLKQAILDQRILVLDKRNNMILGQDIWVDKFMELIAEAEEELQDARTMITDLIDEGEDVSLSESYLDAAEIALEYWNPTRALKLIQNATSPEALGLDFEIEIPDIMSPNTDVSFDIVMDNNHTYAVSFNTSILPLAALSVSTPCQRFTAAAETATSFEHGIHTISFGMPSILLNLYAFNTTRYLMPIAMRTSGIINNVTYMISKQDSGYDVSITCWVGRTVAPTLSSVTLIYNAETGQQEAEMLMSWASYDLTIGSYANGTEIEFSVRIVTDDGITYNLPSISIQVGEVATTTTTTTTTTTPPPDTLLLAAIGVGIIVILIIAGVMRKR